LQEAFDVEAKKFLSARLELRVTRRSGHTPSLTRGRSEFVYFPGMIRIPEGSAPDFKNKSWTIAAEVTIPARRCEWRVGDHRRPLRWLGSAGAGQQTCLAYAYPNQPEHECRADQPLAAGNHVIRVKFEYEGGGIGKAGTATLLVDEGRLRRARLIGPSNRGALVSR
jgi:hypothetical protein